MSHKNATILKVHQDYICFVIIGILKNLDLTLDSMLVINAMMYDFL